MKEMNRSSTFSDQERKGLVVNRHKGGGEGQMISYG